MTTSSPRSCPQCGAPIPDSSSAGLCPRCVFAKVAAPTVEPGEAPHLPPCLEEVRAAFPGLEVISLVGSGGMGSVFKARQPQLDRFVALKILPPELASRARFSGRFQQEAQALARLSHPHIVTIHDYGQAGDFYYLLMEFVDGVNLRQAMRAGRLTPEQALAIVPPVCEALQFAHEHGIVHRDIKPENLLLDKGGRVKIADFGIAKMLGQDGAPASGGEPSESESGASLAAGTPQYMAPEQKAHQVADHRADIYSLGVVLYELLTGELPSGTLQAPSRRVQIDVRLDEIVLRALEARPELRYQTAAEFGTQLEIVTGNPSIQPIAAAPIAKLSRTAVVGACWIIFFFAVVPALVVHELETHEFWRHGPFASALACFVWFGFIIPAFIAPFGATLLGSIAIAQIRGSAGKVHGLWLAVFDALFFPLVVLDALIVLIDLKGRAHLSGAGLTSGVAMAEQNIPATVVLLMLAIILVVDFVIIRGVWSLASKPAGQRPSTPPPNTPLSIAACCLAYSSGLFAAATWLMMPAPPRVFMFGILITALAGLALALPVRRTSAGQQALWFGSIQVAVWLFFAVVLPPSSMYEFARLPAAAVPVDFPKGAHISRKAGTVLVYHDSREFHYLFFAPQAVGSSDSSSRNTHSLAWIENGVFKLTEQQSFGFLRESVDPLHLRINGNDYDLRQGRVFLPHEDGTLEQRQINVPLATALDPDTLRNLLGAGQSATQDATFGIAPR